MFQNLKKNISNSLKAIFFLNKNNKQIASLDMLVKGSTKNTFKFGIFRKMTIIHIFLIVDTILIINILINRLLTFPLTVSRFVWNHYICISKTVWKFFCIKMVGYRQETINLNFESKSHYIVHAYFKHYFH